jgi:hypothetical protein
MEEIAGPLSQARRETRCANAILVEGLARKRFRTEWSSKSKGLHSPSFAVAVIVILNRNLINYRKQLLEPPFEASSFAGARIRAWSIAADPAQR